MQTEAPVIPSPPAQLPLLVSHFVYISTLLSEEDCWLCNLVFCQTAVEQQHIQSAQIRIEQLTAFAINLIMIKHNFVSAQVML